MSNAKNVGISLLAALVLTYLYTLGWQLVELAHMRGTIMCNYIDSSSPCSLGNYIENALLLSLLSTLLAVFVYWYAVLGVAVIIFLANKYLFFRKS